MARHRLVAPRHLAPGVIELSGGVSLPVPPSGVVEVEDAPTYLVPGNFDDRPMQINHTHLRELLAVGFQHAPGASGVADRPPGRYDGEQWFCTYTERPL